MSSAFKTWTLLWFHSLVARLSVNFIFPSSGGFPYTEWKRRGTHLSLHLLRKMPLLSGYSLLQGPLSVRADIAPWRHFLCMMNTRVNLESECPQKPKGLLWILDVCKLPHSPDSEFLLPIRPTKMSCISPEEKNEIHSVLCFMILGNLK